MDGKEGVMSREVTECHKKNISALMRLLLVITNYSRINLMSCAYNKKYSEEHSLKYFVKAGEGAAQKLLEGTDFLHKITASGLVASLLFKYELEAHSALLKKKKNIRIDLSDIKNWCYEIIAKELMQQLKQQEQTK